MFSIGATVMPYLIYRKGSYLAFTNTQSPFIIKGEDYTDENIFQSFKTSHDESCPASDIQKVIGGILLD